MTYRVACADCGAHRDFVDTDHCSVCGESATVPVLPTLADIDQAIARARKNLSYLEGVRLQLQRMGAAAPEAAAN